MIERVMEESVNYLNLKKIREYKEDEYVAYVHDVSIGETRYNDGFVKFFLKDCNSNIVIARLFNVEDFMLSGVNAAAFKHKPVIFRGIAQVFNGSISIVISGKTGIKVYDGDFDYSKFIGKLEVDLSDLEKAASSLGFSLPNQWFTVPLGNLACGKVGGFAKIVEVSHNCLKTFLEGEPQLLPIFLVTMDYWHRYLKSKQNTEVFDYLDSYDYAMQINTRFADDDNKMIYLDAFNAVIGAKKPRHLFAHLIKNAVDFAISNVSLQIKFDSQVLATTCSVGGVELSKY